MCEDSPDSLAFDSPYNYRMFMRSSSQNVSSLPSSYSYRFEGASQSMDATCCLPTSPTISLISNEMKFLRSRPSEPNFYSYHANAFLQPSVSYQKFSNESFPRTSTETLSSHKFSKRRLPTASVRRNQTYAGFQPMFHSIPSMDSDHDSESSATNYRRLRKSISVDSPPESPGCYLRKTEFIRAESYLSSEVFRNVLGRSSSSIAIHQNADVRRGRIYNRDRRDSLKLDLKYETFLTGTSPDCNSRDYRNIKTKNVLKHDDSIASIISEVKSKMVLSRSHRKHKETENDDEALKEQLEGRVVSPKMKDDLIKPKYISEKAIGLDNKFAGSAVAATQNEESENVFEKCRSTISASSIEAREADDEGIVDEVFESPSKHKKANNSVRDKTVRPKLSRQSASLESSLKKRGKSAERRSRNSSVSIEEKPDYHEYCSPTKSGKIPSSHAIAKSQTKSPRTSTTQSTIKTKTPSGSDYDRDRGRSRHLEGGHRESFKKNERTNERNSEQDRDASDREHKDGSLNRSLSNTDTNLEDRIGE